MSAIEYFTKWIVAILVVALVIWTVSKFGGNIIDFFKNLGGNSAETGKIIFSLLK